MNRTSSIGKITSGEMNGDTLFAQYKSAQEGMVSDCEIALEKKTALIYSERLLWH